MTTSIRAPQCKVCDERHWSHQPHKTDGVKVRPMVREFVSEKPRTITADIKDQGVKPFRKPRTVKLRDGAADDFLAAMDRCSCGKALPERKRGPAPKFCSDTCRKRASRGKR